MDSTDFSGEETPLYTQDQPVMMLNYFYAVLDGFDLLIFCGQKLWGFFPCKNSPEVYTLRLCHLRSFTEFDSKAGERKDILKGLRL